MENMGGSESIQDLRVDRAKDWLAGKESAFIFLDVRQPEEYIKGHLPGAVLIPLATLIDNIGQLDHAKPVMVYCRSGNRSRAAAGILQGSGFSKVYNLVGGITAWNGQVATGSYDEGLYLLNGRETAEELTSLALALEEGSYKFYSTLIELTRDVQARSIFADLAESEARHKMNIFKAYKAVSGKDLGEDIKGRETLNGVMESGVRIDDAINFIKQRGLFLLDMLELSMQLETNAIDLYIKIYQRISNEDAKKVFDSIIIEEKRHLYMLGKLIGERVT